MLTTHLPSGYHYEFPAINLKPMTFLQVLDYLENCPTDPLEKLQFDYSVIKADDPNVDNLLITDFEYVLFVKQVMSIDENKVWHINAKCPKCGRNIEAAINIENIKFKKIDEKLLYGLNVELAGTQYSVRIPTVGQFIKVFQKYRNYRRITDLRLIKIISLFDVEGGALNVLENRIKNATHAQIKELIILEKLMLDSVEPIKVVCEDCAIKHEPEPYELDEMAEKLGVKVSDLSDDDISLIKLNYGGTEVSIEGLTSSIFQYILQYNTVDRLAIQYKQTMQGE